MVRWRTGFQYSETTMQRIRRERTDAAQQSAEQEREERMEFWRRVAKIVGTCVLGFWVLMVWYALFMVMWLLWG